MARSSRSRRLSPQEYPIAVPTAVRLSASHTRYEEMVRPTESDIFAESFVDVRELESNFVSLDRSSEG